MAWKGRNNGFGFPKAIGLSSSPLQTKGMKMHRFDQDISFKHGEPFSFSGHIADSWSINGVPDGGYLMAILAKAMMHHSEMNSTPLITANFLNRCEPGDATVAVEKMSASRQFERLQGSLWQKDKERIRAFGTFSGENNACFLERSEASCPEMAALEQCVPVPDMPNFSLFSRLDIRLDPACTGWWFGQLSETSEIKGWVKFKKSRPFDLASILLIADSFPPAVLSSQGMVAWVPTIEMSVNIRKIPTTDWLKCSFRTRFITCGLLEEDGEIWDEKGELIAISRQIAQYRTQNQ
jgi:acyl-CoA thioesterase